MPPAFVLSQDQTLRFIPGPILKGIPPFGRPSIRAAKRSHQMHGHQTTPGCAGGRRPRIPSLFSTISINNPQSQLPNPRGAALIGPPIPTRQHPFQDNAEAEAERARAVASHRHIDAAAVSRGMTRILSNPARQVRQPRRRNTASPCAWPRQRTASARRPGQAPRSTTASPAATMPITPPSTARTRSAAAAARKPASRDDQAQPRAVLAGDRGSPSPSADNSPRCAAARACGPCRGCRAGWRSRPCSAPKLVSMKRQ